MPIYVDESGGLHAGAMTMAAVEIDAGDAEQLLGRFRAITALRGELKGSRIDLVERGLFFELLARFGGRARIGIIPGPSKQSAKQSAKSAGQLPKDFDVYVTLLNRLVDDWLPETGGCANFEIDEGRYNDLMLEEVRRDVQHVLQNCGTAKLVDSRRSPGVQIADVVANSFYNLATRSGHSKRIQRIVDPFLENHVLRTAKLKPPPLASRRK